MTIEEADQTALDAAQKGDLTALQAALDARAASIAALVRAPPSRELAERLNSTIAVGTTLQQKLALMQAGLDGPFRSHIDCLG
jgi:hypothetical protein